MANWRKTCTEFKEVRRLIDVGDSKGIMDTLVSICEKYSKQKWNYAEDFEYLCDEIKCAIEDGEYEDDDSVDYYLREFYDLCDTARVWLDL